MQLALQILVRHLEQVNWLFLSLPYSHFLVDYKAVPHYCLYQESYWSLRLDFPVPICIIPFGRRMRLWHRECGWLALFLFLWLVATAVMDIVFVVPNENNPRKPFVAPVEQRRNLILARLAATPEECSAVQLFVPEFGGR